jgi:16S rRNA (guanine527-N7)-methyltransferase
MVRLNLHRISTLDRSEMIAPTRIDSLLAPYGVAIDAGLHCQIQKYIDLLLLWNQKISLTAIVDIEKILRFHFGESLFARNSVPVEKGRLADVGSGAGFPGLPLAMASPLLQVTLIEANQKKATFLSEVVRALGLPNVEIARSRVENLARRPRAFDFLTARALGHHQDLIEWAESLLADSGKLILWVGREDAESLSRTPGWNWRKAIKIPSSRSRFLLVGTPQRNNL